MSKVRFQDIVKKKDGFLRGPFGGDLKKDIFVEKSSDTYKVYEQGVVLNNDERIGRYYISNDYFKKKMYRFEVKPKDFLVSCSGVNYGAIHQLSENIEKGVINQALLRIRLDSDKVDDNYFYYLFKALIVNMIVGKKGDSTIPNFPPLSVIKALEFELPEKNEQIQIGRLLSHLDQKIELNNRINVELEAMAKTLYDYWFVQFDFPDGNGSPYKSSGGKMVYNPTLKREIPEGWKVKKLADVTSLIRRGISPKYTDEGGISVLNQKCVRDQKISFEDARRHKIELDDKDERLLKPFDVVVNSTGVGTLGRVAYVKRLPEKKTTVDSHVSIVRANPELLPPQYLAWKLMRHQPVIESAANGSTGQVELSKSFLEDIDVIIPSDSIVKRFEEFVTPLVPELAARETENEQLIQLRDWLLPMLMNGQITVK
ncbi:restriction endonuclease subunit S [Vibrio sp. 2304]|uniref:restriction endonuclease subunit S n=1 Tax=Vibrio sp. 2304 TaxID=3074601 RepID=UPI002965034B|nr:restriction endonuclease subunit S [Vibrio sp. 2304]MDW2001554.1 restriction endonuclease subunit S [Vibrio sp. 2304]